MQLSLGIGLDSSEKSGKKHRQRSRRHRLAFQTVAEFMYDAHSGETDDADHDEEMGLIHKKLDAGVSTVK